MAKNRKTRQEKKLADLRHNFVHSSVNQITFEAKTQQKELIKAFSSPKLASANSYPYLVKDLSKTGILTLTILAFQTILFILLKKHIFVIPGLSY